MQDVRMATKWLKVETDLPPGYRWQKAVKAAGIKPGDRYPLADIVLNAAPFDDWQIVERGQETFLRIPYRA